MQSWLAQKVFDVVNKKVANNGSSDESSMGVDEEVHQQSQGTPLCLGVSRPRPDRSSPRDSTTLSAQAEALILQRVASHKWKLVSGDIKTAFLSGDEEHRNIFILPPDDVRDILKLIPESMPRLRKSCVRSRENPEEVVGSFEANTSESWSRILCGGSVCLRPHQTTRSQRCDWSSCGRLAGKEAVECLTDTFWKSSASSILVLGMSEP